MSATVIRPLPGIGRAARLLVWVRGVFSRRALLRLAGIETVVLAGIVRPVRPVPLGVARELVPAIVRCSQAFATWNVDESLYDDMVKVLSLGLGIAPRQVERLSVSIWDLTRVIDLIARVNGLQVVEAGRADLGKLAEALTSMNSTPSSSAPPAGPGNTSTDA
jgi:hypothetical protein